MKNACRAWSKKENKFYYFVGAFNSRPYIEHSTFVQKDLTLADRVYKCDCGLEIDRDLNAAINILKAGLNALSLEYSDYKHGEIVRPKEIIYNFDGQF